MWQAEDCFCLRLKRASEELMKTYAEVLAPSGVTPVQHLILGRIYEREGASLCEVAEAVGVDRSTLARTIKPLVSAGYVVDAKPVGTRNSQLRLTADGERVFWQAHKLWSTEQDRVAQRLGPEGMEAFSAVADLVKRF